ncbi:MAG: hypothetical protein E6K81_13775 [Candidatus Eisenbacteria bacterium]|uniref:HEAT repeat domain-containing protein n=1 Tax=Eiseniibacteriota bacterium TaxID=2212470 RepID=A0A538U223_UNCEI|nr:MAG: hypothetical protein E6K81_13775 [Candidatus Eisenbacteria bacterium]
MEVQHQAHGPIEAAAPEGGPPADAHLTEPVVKAVAAWVNQFARTLKTGRLYHPNNPVVVRFRGELIASLTRLLDEVGPFTCKFTNDDILFDDVSLHPAKSRDDNLALHFHRDGVRALTFNPGITARELDALLDAVALVSGKAQVEDDLVTLFWQANLDHVDVDYVPAEGDVGAGAEGEALVPWPTAAADETPEAPTDAAAETTPAASGSRSDDWSTGEATVEVEAGFDELDTLARGELDRFRAEFAAEHEVSIMTTALAIARAYLNAGATREDRVELGRFLPRMLRLALAEGSWLEAREGLALLRACESDQWSVETFTQELFQPISVATTVEILDRQEGVQVAEFVALARTLGEQAVEWLNLTLAESQQRRTRRALAEAISDLCRDHPEQMAQLVGDPRWYVVRNAVQILGWIGGDGIIGLLRAAMRHRDPRVRREVVAALGRVSDVAARPLLLEMLTGADTRLFCAVLHQLVTQRDAETAHLLVGYLRNPTYDRRPDAEKHAIVSTLGAVGTDDALPDLEAELAKGNWLARGAETHRLAIARCIARIGTPRARDLLERGALSRRGAVRDACVEAVKGLHGHP